MAGLFQVLWGQPGGTFKKAAELTGTDGKPLIIPNKGEDDVVESICTRPTAVDWNGDGALDLVVGNFAGKFYLFSGEGGGKFAPTPQVIKAGDEPLLVKGHHGDPFFVDWDNDGDLDLLSGSGGGGVWLAENTAGVKKAVVLKPFKALIEAPARVKGECRPAEVDVPDGSTRVWVADMNGDGKLDVLVGDQITLISPAEGVSEADFTRQYAEYKSAMDAAMAEAEGTKDEEKLMTIYERIGRLRDDRQKFLEDDATGFVWVYLRK